jgi:hypothetical protein
MPSSKPENEDSIENEEGGAEVEKVSSHLD